MRKGYTALVLSEETRAALLERFTPKFATVVCHHITWAYGVPEDSPLPHVNSVRIVGYAVDDRGIECLVAEVDGSTSRPEGGTYHITLSLAEGREPAESNTLLAECSFVGLAEPITITVTPAFILSNS